MKKHLLFAALMLCGTSALAVNLSQPGNGDQAGSQKQHRYVIERTFPKGALDGLDADAKANVNQTNARFGVRWLMSYANADRTRTFCIYDAPNEDAIRDAAQANHLPVDKITEVPVTLTSH